MRAVISKCVLLFGILHIAVSHSPRRNHFGRNRHFSKNGRSCPLPVPDTSFSLQWVKTNQPENGFITELGNNIARLYIAQVLQEKVLAGNVDFSQLCSRLKLIVTERGNTTTVINGSRFGYVDKRIDYNCTLTRKYPGTFQCHYLNAVIGKLEYSYPSLAEKNFAVETICTPEGRRGWYTISNATLSENDKQIVLAHVESLGFNRSFVQLFDSNHCAAGPKQL